MTMRILLVLGVGDDIPKVQTMTRTKESRQSDKTCKIKNISPKDDRISENDSP